MAHVCAGTPDATSCLCWQIYKFIFALEYTVYPMNSQWEYSKLYEQSHSTPSGAHRTETAKKFDPG